MEIVFGMELDGPCAGPEGFEKNYAGRQVLGPMGLAKRLGTQYGVVMADTGIRQRAGLLEQRLASRPMAQAFFHESFLADPEGTCMRLLELRDDILMNSAPDFSFTKLPDGAGRLDHMTALAEKGYFDGIENSLADFYRGIAGIIREGQIASTIEKLILRDPRASLPRLPAEIVSLLEAAGTMVEQWRPAPVKSAGDLGAAAAAGEEAEKADAAGDGSLVFLNGKTSLETAETLAAMVAALSEHERVNTLLITGGDAGVLEDAFGRFGLVPFGARRMTTGAAPSQMLPQYFCLLHQGFDPDKLVDYLQNPCTPLPGKLRYGLLNAFCELPGIENEKWAGAIKAWRETQEDQKAAENVLAKWLAVGKCPVDGEIPAAGLAELCRAHSDWIAVKLGKGLPEDDRKSYEKARERADALADAFQFKEQKAFTARRLANFMSRFLQADQDAGTYRRRGSVMSVKNVAAVMRPYDIIIWWQADGGEIPSARPLLWNGGEVKVLAAAGTDAAAIDRRVSAHFQAAMEMARLAGKNLVLAYSQDRDNQSIPHPLRYMLLRAFKDSGKAEKTLSAEAGKLESGKVPPLLQLGKAKIAVNSGKAGYRPPPEKWTIGKGVWKKKDVYSPSSLSPLLSCPLQGVLAQQAALSAETPVAVEDSVLLLGNLSHEVLENFVKTADWGGKVPDGSALDALIRKELEKALNRRGIRFFQPAKAMARQELLGTLQRAAGALRAFMLNGKYIRAVVEQNLAPVATEIGDVYGRLDLVVYRDDDVPVILDFKWGGAEGKTAQIRQGRAVQLAVYSRIADGQWPTTAFFLISIEKNKLISRHGAEVYPDVQTVKDSLDEKETWDAVVKNVKAEMAQLKDGEIGIGLDDDSWVNGEGHMGPAECKYCDFSMLCRQNEEV